MENARKDPQLDNLNENEALQTRRRYRIITFIAAIAATAAVITSAVMAFRGDWTWMLMLFIVALTAWSAFMSCMPCYDVSLLGAVLLWLFAVMVSVAFVIRGEMHYATLFWVLFAASLTGRLVNDDWWVFAFTFIPIAFSLGVVQMGAWMESLT